MIAERPQLGPHKQRMAERLAGALGSMPACVNVKATTNEGMGFVGRGEGIAALAVAQIERQRLSDDPHPRLADAARCARSSRASPGKVGIYACGPTVYGRIHVGNARPYVVFALLKRFLEHEGYDVTLVENITDVNDKIYDAARAAGVPSEQPGARDDRGLSRRHRPARARPARPRAAREPDHRPRSST